MKAIRIAAYGGPDVMTLTDVPVPEPGPGEIRVRHGAVGINFIDTYHRTGLYPLSLPAGIGVEAAGTVEAVGPGVEEFEVDDRVVYFAGGGPGSYAEAHVVPTGAAARLPELVGDEDAAAIFLKGLTAWFLLNETYKVKAGETIVLHAAAGGVGLILCQWAKHLGATVIGTVGSEDKAALARAHGCDHPVLYRSEDLVAKVKALTDGKGVGVVYDGVGKDTFETSLDCLRPRGLLVSYGNASGPVTGVNLGILALKGSLYVTRPTLGHFVGTRADLDRGAKALFDLMNQGAVKADIHQRYALADAAKAHQDLEGRKTSGASVLIP